MPAALAGCFAYICLGREDCRIFIFIDRHAKKVFVPKLRHGADHKEATLNVILAKIPDTSTFAQLAELIGYSHEWVRLRLVSAPEKLYRIGRRYQVPKGTAEEFIRSIFV